jgi:predicted aminopeptidase
MTLLRVFVLLAVSAGLQGCYLMQAAAGQMNIVAKREPIAKVIANPATPEKLKTRLEYVAAARDFASRELGLPDNPSYRSYADVGRPYVVWNVFATPEFSVEPIRWCFPIAGCVVYRGYFSEAGANDYARRLRLRGDDTAVGGVAAYSTLGHFRDPVLNTMLGWSDAQLASTIFHELAHQVLYVPGESEFNESFATVVEDAGLERWLAARGRKSELTNWNRDRERYADFIALLLETRNRLRELYGSSVPPATMRTRKQEEFGLLKLRYGDLKKKWGGYAGYDNWFGRTLNNANLVSAATYHGCVPGLTGMLEEVNGDLARFYEAAKQLAGASADARRRQVCSVEDVKE